MTRSDGAHSIEGLASRAICVVWIDPDDWALLSSMRDAGTRFSLIFPHEVARQARPDFVALFAVDSEPTILLAGVVASVQAVSSLTSRVLFELVAPVAPGSIEKLMAEVDTGNPRLRAARWIQANATGMSAVSEKLGQSMSGHISAIPENEASLMPIVERLARPKVFSNARALQADAIRLALHAFGSTESASALALSRTGSTLGGVRLQEDAVIEHDARWIPGWNLEESALTGKAVFRQRDEKLEIFTANKRPLEELFGVDLIYLNERRGSLVMVQYKMMEPSRAEFEQEPGEWIVPIDAQFQDEVARMERFDRDLSPDGPYRLNPGAFYFKMVKRNAAVNTPALLVSLEHLRQLQRDGEARGPRGGLRISYKDMDGHYLRSDGFVELVRSGYIGSRGATSAHFQSLIQATLDGGRAVVAALQSALASTGA